MYILSALGVWCDCGTWAAASPVGVTGIAGVTWAGVSWADTECAGQGGPWLMTAGVSAAAAVNSSRAAVTSRCASDWVAPASGTFGLASAWLEVLLAAALISTSTHHTSWIQASQTITDKMRRIAVMSSWLVSADSLGRLCGSGRPTTVISAIGTPTVSAISRTMAPTPASTSPGDRRLIWTGWRSAGRGTIPGTPRDWGDAIPPGPPDPPGPPAISRPPGRQRCRRPGRPFPTPAR